MEEGIDAIDLRILMELQENARISNAELARLLGMAPSAVLERTRKLEQQGIVRHYTAVINAGSIGKKLLAFIFIKVVEGLGSSQAGDSLSSIQDVQEVHHIAGEDCYLVKVRTNDAASLMSLMRHHFSKVPGILSTKTTIVLETVKENQRLVIPQTEKKNDL